MSSAIRNSRARAVADFATGELLATVEIAASPERVFKALASEEIVEWWTGEGLGQFRTTSWKGDVRVGGRWQASGEGEAGDGVMKPFVLEGEFLEVTPPRKLVHTYGPPGVPPTTVSYDLEQIPGGTRITLRHVGFKSRDFQTSTYLGWESLLDRLAARLSRK
jgi:uncharacterized protein YndB with AHSA1/START domain